MWSLRCQTAVCALLLVMLWGCCHTTTLRWWRDCLHGWGWMVTMCFQWSQHQVRKGLTVTACCRCMYMSCQPGHYSHDGPAHSSCEVWDFCCSQAVRRKVVVMDAALTWCGVRAGETSGQALLNHIAWPCTFRHAFTTGTGAHLHTLVTV